MKVVRSDAPEVARCAATARARVSMHLPGLAVPVVYGFFPNALILLVSLTLGVFASVRGAVWVGVPAFLAWNGYLLWWTQSARRNWIIAGCDDRAYARLFAWRRKGHGDAREPDVILLEGSEIASVSARRLEVFLSGSRPKIVQWLVIKPSEAIAEDVTERVRRLLGLPDPNKSVYVAIEDGCFVFRWEWCHPALRTFLQRLARECPSLVIGDEERSELDLNGVWSTLSMRLNLRERQRQMLVQARRLGFGCKCASLLARYEFISFREAQRYLAKLEREDAGAEQAAAQQ